MAESSTPVRLLQHHLRESGLLMAAGQFDAAAGHLDAALAIDPESLTALALREKLTLLRASDGRLTEVTKLRADAPVPQPAEAADTKASAVRFVPHGVDAGSWTDFEQRVQQRRFRALIEAGERALAAGDLAAARTALEEARELQPESLEVSRLSIRLAAMPLNAATAKRNGVFHARTVRAASLLLLGVSLLMGLDWIRSEQSAPSAANTASVGTGGEDTSTVSNIAVYEGDGTVSRSAETDGPSPAVDTARVARRSDELPVTRDAAPVSARVSAPVRERPSFETPDTYVAAPASPVAANAVTTVPPIGGEIPDNYVAPRRSSGDVRGGDAPSVTAAGRGTPSAIANVVRQPVPVAESLGASPNVPSTPVPAPTVSPAPVVPSAAAGAAAIVSNTNESVRVRSVLDQYARAIGRLDASAVRAVYPSVDQGGLAKAFSTLNSQTVWFETCDIALESTSSAKAFCRGKASYVGKVGSQEPRTESRSVTFELKRDGDAWKIQKAQTGR